MIKSMAVRAGLNRWSGKDRFLTLRKVSASEGKPFQSARKFSPRLPEERNLFLKVQYNYTKVTFTANGIQVCFGFF